VNGLRSYGEDSHKS